MEAATASHLHAVGTILYVICIHSHNQFGSLYPPGIIGSRPALSGGEVAVKVHHDGQGVDTKEVGLHGPMPDERLQAQQTDKR